MVAPLILSRSMKAPKSHYIALGVLWTFVVFGVGYNVSLMNYRVVTISVPTLSVDPSVRAATGLRSSTSTVAPPPFDSAVENAQRMKSIRNELREQCDASKSASDVVHASEKQLKVFTTKPIPKVYADVNAVRRCKNVILDFGANVGDTFAYFMDAGVIPCDRSQDIKDAPTQKPHYNLETKKFELANGRNYLVSKLERLLRTRGYETGPEDYCYYGVEGNPVFTKRLQEIEEHAMGTSPRPVQHMHFFTDSVGAGEDGMTKLYLDTVNTEQNFWGSSIFKTHPDVRKSAGESDVETLAVPVMGYTIGTLMRMTLNAFDSKMSTPDRVGGHFILKVDIEGGEYPLLEQAVLDGTLCEFVKIGNTADLFIEFHGIFTDSQEKQDKIRAAMQSCGVNAPVDITR